MYTKQGYREDLAGLHGDAATTADDWRVRGGHLIKVGNLKLGDRGRYGTMLVTSGLAYHDCPGKTEACMKICYAERFRYLAFLSKRNGSNHIYSYLAHHDMGKLKAWLIEDLKFFSDRLNMVRCPIVVRIHEAGDFINAAHVEMWGEIAKVFPKIQFYGYTHSFRVLTIRPALNEINRLPNVRIRNSYDNDEAPPVGAEGLMAPNIAFVSGSVMGAKKYYTNGLAKAPYHKGAVRCPEQVTGGKINCVDCGVCWRTDKPVQFFKH